MDDHLVYDVGMHNGDDTAHYLREGYRVVAIEADPALVAAARTRFSEAVASGQLTILEVAIGPEAGTVPFWVSTNPEYNSLDRANADKWGHTSEKIEVPARPFEDILATYGVPLYLKIDIEGADHYCLEAIDPADPPAFVSFEKDRFEDLLIARDRGYSRFKLIDQETFEQLAYPPEKPSRAEHLRNRLRHWTGRLVRRLSLPTVRNGDQEASGGHTAFPYGSSGPFGEATDGPWRTWEEVALAWFAFDLGYTGADDPEWEDWFDVHCAL